jgi:hypothetical protein
MVQQLVPPGVLVVVGRQLAPVLMLAMVLMVAVAALVRAQGRVWACLVIWWWVQVNVLVKV